MEIRSILLVDDDPYFLRTLERTLKRERYEIFTASNAKKASKVLHDNPIDCIISDYRMPGISGVDFLKWARKNYPHVIRIIITGQADTQSAIRAINEGEVFRYLTKPFKPEMLLDTLREAFKAADQKMETIHEIEARGDQRGNFRKLEKMYPGITRVCRSQDGAIILSHEDNTLEELERMFPGITRVCRSRDGAIVFSDEDDTRGENAGGQEEQKRPHRQGAPLGRHGRE